MYTSNTNHGTIYISDKLFDRLPDGIGEYVWVETPEIDSIDIAEWSANELNVPPYPEVRIYKNVARKICEYAENPDGSKALDHQQIDHRKKHHRLFLHLRGSEGSVGFAPIVNAENIDQIR